MFSTDKDMQGFALSFVEDVWCCLMHRMLRFILKISAIVKNSKDYIKTSYGGKQMTIVCVDDHPIMLGGLMKNVRQLLPDASVAAFTNADAAVGFTKENGCDVLISEIELCGTDGLTLAEVRRHTGRSHQIRVQMNAIGTPVYGDMRYGGEKAKKGYLSLWAYYLSFIHPVSKEKMVFRVQPPKDRNPWQKFDTDRAVTIIKPNM